MSKYSKHHYDDGESDYEDDEHDDLDDSDIEITKGINLKLPRLRSQSKLYQDDANSMSDDMDIVKLIRSETTKQKVDKLVKEVSKGGDE